MTTRYDKLTARYQQTSTRRVDGRRHRPIAFEAATFVDSTGSNAPLR
ncbi:hypothetical protein ACFVY0_42760 [Streptomyces sp. NPDC058286]